MLSIVTWKWSTPGYRSTFGPETVNVLKAMVDRHYSDPHRFICVTSEDDGIDKDVEIVTPWNDFIDLPSPHDMRSSAKMNPSCYRRLRAYHPEIGATFGPRFVMVDLDTVITGDLRPLWNRTEEFVSYGDTNPQPGSHYNGSMCLMTAGARSKVWTEFDPATSPAKALRAGCWGSDQGWISYCLGPKEAKWTKADGVYSFRNHLKAHGETNLPRNAKMVIFHGNQDPWSEESKRIPWIREHYRIENAVCR